jgi:uncharacterized membrane protein YbhN (UPF0104 family)
VRKTFWAWARLVGGLGIVAVLLWRLGTTPFLAGLRVLDGGTLLAAAAIGALTTVASAWRWCQVGRGLGIRLPLPRAVADYYQALFLNAALPGGVLGDVQRAVGNGRESGDVGRGVRAVVLERSAGQIALVAVAAAMLLADPLSVLPQVPFGTIAAVSAAGVLVALALARLGRRPGGSRWARAWRTATRDVRRGLLNRRTAPGVLLASVAVLAGHVATFVVAALAAGADVPIARLAPLALLALLAMAVPLNVGGWGPREGVTAWAFGAAGLGASRGVATAVVYGVMVFAATLPGAAVLLATAKRHA